MTTAFVVDPIATLAAPLVEQEARFFLDDLVAPNDIAIERPGGPPPTCVGSHVFRDDLRVVVGVRSQDAGSHAIVVHRLNDTFHVIARDATQDGGDLLVAATPSGVLRDERSRPDTFTFHIRAVGRQPQDGAH